MIEKQVDIPTKAGTMDTFICHPERRGPWPVVIFYMDAPGIREELRDMARRIATVGYYVLLPNLYYRTAREGAFDPGKLQEDGPDRKRMWELLRSLSNALVMDDTEAMLTFIDRQKDARKGPLGCVGYCMSGPFVFTAAGRFPDRFAATASIYGAGLLTDRPDSPHLLAGEIKGEIYFACAETDKYAPLPVIEQLREVLQRASATYEIEIYPSTEHGFAFPQRYCYDKSAAERHWERLFDLFRRRLVTNQRM